MSDPLVDSIIDTLNFKHKVPIHDGLQLEHLSMFIDQTWSPTEGYNFSPSWVPSPTPALRKELVMIMEEVLNESKGSN